MPATAQGSMCVSYDAAVQVAREALGWPEQKVEYLFRNSDGGFFTKPERTDAPSINAFRLGEFIRLNYCDRNNPDY